MIYKAQSICIILLLLAQLTIAQTTKTEYYDYYKTKIKEEYQANVEGQVNGWYKGYDESGVIIIEGQAINGQKTGIWNYYTTINGKRKLSKLETYENNFLNGDYKTYGGTNGDILMQSGRMKDGEFDGEWEMMAPAPLGWDMNYNDCSYIKVYTTYKNGDKVSTKGAGLQNVLCINGNVTIISGYMPDGTYKDYYYPCKKLFTEYTVTSGQIIGEHKQYYPDGKLMSIATYSYNNGKQEVLTYMAYYPNGQKKYVYDNTGYPFKYEEYQDDGKPTFFMLSFEDRRKEDAKKFISPAWKNLLAQKYDDAISDCQKGLKLDGTSLYLWGNLAHAYLLIGKYDDALLIYQKYMGSMLNDKVSWSAMIIDDFSKFKAAGIESPNMDKVLIELNLK